MLKPVTISALAALLAFTQAGCASYRDLPRISAAEANSAVEQVYALSPGDQLRVTVFDEETLTGEYQVGMDGMLSLPLIEPIGVAGLSEWEVAESIGGRLSSGGYVIRPRVSVSVMRYRPIYILGEVNTPGEYPFTGDLTFLSAIAKAGGYTPRARKNQVMLLRSGWPTGRLVDLSSIPLVIAPGDTIVVQESLL